MARTVICLIFLTISFSRVLAEDAIKAELDKARAIYSEQIESAKLKFLSAAELKLKEYADKGDFESATEVKDQKEAFEKDGKLPSSSKLSSAKGKYEAELRAAKAAFQKDLEKATSEYTKAQRFSEAQAINTELKELTSNRNTRKTHDKGSEDLLQQGTVWKGYKTYARGKKVEYQLQIDSRDGTKFIGVARGNPTYSVWDVAGTVDDGTVEWKVTKVRSGVGAAPNSGVLAGDKLRFTFQGPRGNTGTGELTLDKNSRAPSDASLGTQASPPAETPQSQKMPRVADFEKFLTRYDAEWDQSQRRLEQAIKNRIADIRGSNLDGDEKQRRVEVIDKDLAALKETERLPSSDDLLDVVVNLLEDRQKMIENLESMRAYWSDRAVRLKDDGAIAKLTALEQRLDKIIGGREQFATGSKWSGKRQTDTKALQIILTVTNRTGTSFVGRLRQTLGGPGIMMDVDGKLDRNRIAFRSTQMIRGGNRQLGFSGYLLSDRIITSVEGIQVDGKPATGWMSLWRNGTEPGKAGRRGRVSMR